MATILEATITQSTTIVTTITQTTTFNTNTTITQSTQVYIPNTSSNGLAIVGSVLGAAIAGAIGFTITRKRKYDREGY